MSTGQEDCSRCSRLGLDCKRDTTYKRQSKSRYVRLLYICRDYETYIKNRKIAELEKQVQLLTSAFNGPKSPPGDIRRSTENARPSNPQTLQTNLALNFRENNPTTTATFNNPAASVNLNSWLDSQPHLSANGPSFNPDLQSLPNTAEETSSTHSGFRPSAVLSRSIKSVHLSATQIDNLFQM